MSGKLPSDLTRKGKTRKCHRCGMLLPDKSAVSYRGSRPYCKECVNLCRNKNCNNSRGLIYAHRGLCDVCGLARQHARLGSKHCSQCGIEIPREGKHALLCKSCRISSEKSTEQKRGLRLKQERKQRFCRQCGKLIGKNYRYYCDSCRDIRFQNLQRLNAKVQKKKRRAAAYGVRFEFSEEAWRQLLDHFGHKCAYCERAVGKLEQDHVVPLSKGGSHIADNIVPACRSCNARKSTRSLADFLAQLSTRTDGEVN